MLTIDYFAIIKLRMEMGNVSKRQQPDIEQTTAEGHQQVFNAARNSCTQRRPSGGPLTNIYTSSVIMNLILNSELYIRN